MSAAIPWNLNSSLQPSWLPTFAHTSDLILKLNLQLAPQFTGAAPPGAGGQAHTNAEALSPEQEDYYSGAPAAGDLNGDFSALQGNFSTFEGMFRVL